MFKVYAEKDIFENIVVFSNETPNWYKIFCNHSDVCLNITEAELIAEQIPGTPIFEFILANGGRSPKSKKSYFTDIYKDTSIIADKPRSVFFLNISEEEAKVLQKNYGVAVQGKTNIDDSILKGTFYKEVFKNSFVEDGVLLGWKKLLNFDMPPSNSIVITDDYLFSNEENGQSVGKSNLIQLLDALLPSILAVPFHVLIVANDHPESNKPPKTDIWCTRISTEIVVEVKALRTYEIVVEIVFTRTIHKRKLLINYLNVTTDKGFCFFKISDGKTVRDDNDVRCDRIFNRLEHSEGDTDYISSESILLQLKRKCDGVKQFIENRGQFTQNRIVGNCNPNFSIKNRLINDV